MRLFAWLLMATLAATGQAIDAGGTTDANYTGGLVWNPTVAGYVYLGAIPWEDLRYGQSFSYSIPEPNGLYMVELWLMEPNKTAAGQRIFTVSANGSSSAPLDLFKLAGLRTRYLVKLFTAVNNGVLRLDFRASVGNAVVSNIVVTQLLPQGGTVQLTELHSGPVVDGSVRLANGGFVDVHQTTLQDYVNALAAAGPVCGPEMQGIMRLVNSKFGLCWLVNGTWTWTNELPAPPTSTQ